MKLENLLSPGEFKDFNALVTQANEQGAQAVRWYSTTTNVLVLGICAQGELLTWFASPAHSAAEGELIQTIILNGLSQTGMTTAIAKQNAFTLASDAIQKASTRH